MATCPHCGYEAGARDICPLCGAGIAGTDAPDASRTGSGTTLPPWEDPNAAFPKNFTDTWVESVFRPGAFFKDMPWESAAVRPVLYYLVLAIISAVFALWWTAAFAAMGFSFAWDETLFESLSPAASALVNFFATPFLAIIGLVLWSLILHLPVLVFARERKAYRATVRAVCYASGPTLFAVVPYLGALAGLFWSLGLTVIGLRDAHRMTTGAAIACVVLAFLLPLTLVFAFMILVFASLATLA